MKKLWFAHALGLTNAAFFAANANVNLRPLLESAGEGTELASVSIQFPDPWFKAKHKKRRVVKPDLIRAIADHLPSGVRSLAPSSLALISLAQPSRPQLSRPAIARS